MEVTLATAEELSEFYFVSVALIKKHLTPRGTYQPTKGRGVRLYDPDELVRVFKL